MRLVLNAMPVNTRTRETPPCTMFPFDVEEAPLLARRERERLSLSRQDDGPSSFLAARGLVNVGIPRI